jgi:hypothetical protein
MSQSTKLSTRISAGLATLIRGLSENENAATRALLLIGANQLGIDPTLLADDLRTTLSARLPAEVYTMLLEMWSRTDRTATSTVSREQPEQAPRWPHLLAPARAPATQPERGVAPDAGDPFSAVGFDFDEGG